MAGGPAGALMPRRDDISSILVIGSGPIVIGQACEFDYSGTQACRVLAEEGYRVVLANSNPATIMTDPADGRPHLRRAARPRGAGGDHRAGAARRPAAHPGRPDRPQPHHGAWPSAGSLDAYGVEVIGARPEAIRTAEDRDRFKAAMAEIGLEVPESGFAHSLDEALAIAERDRLPDHGAAELHPRRARARASPPTATSLRRAGRRGPRRQPGRPRSSSSARSPAGRSTSSR